MPTHTNESKLNKQWIWTGIAALVVIGIIIAFFIFDSSKNEEKSSESDRQSIEALNYDLIDAIGKVDEPKLKEISCKNGVFANGLSNKLSELQGIKITNITGIPEEPDRSKTVTTTISYDIPERTRSNGEVLPRIETSGEFNFRYEDNHWCVA